jgi:serine/arginine repetitive matrix protein 2
MPINDEDEDENNNSSTNKTNNTNDDDDDDEENDDDDHEGDGDDEDDAQEPVQVLHRSPSHRTSLELKDFLVERETSPEVMPSRIPPPSPAAALSNFTRLSDDYGSAPTYPPPALATTSFGQTPANGEYTDWEDQRTAVADVAPKRSEGGYWERVKNTFTRTGSQSGRRSRTNSVGTRQLRDNTDSSVSRESGASLTSAKTDKGDTSGTFAYQQSQTPIQTHTSSPASASVLSLAPHAPKGGVSPIPAASNADLLKYADAKLFPFPGMMELEKQRTRAKGMLNSASTPDIVLGLDQPMPSSGSSSLTTRSPDTTRDRNLSHQASDSRLIAKFSSAHSPQIMSAAPSSNSIDYFSIPALPSATPTQSGSMKLPTTREGVKKWLTAKKIFSSSSGTSTPNVTSPSPVSGLRTPPNLKTQPSISDLFISRKDTDLTADWEDVGSDKSRTVTSTSGSTLRGKGNSNLDVTSQFSKAVDEAFSITASGGSLSKVNSSAPFDLSDTPKSEIASDPPSTIPSPPEPPSSTPDPQSSLDDYPTRSTSASFSTLSSHPIIDSTCQEPQNLTLLERIDDLLGRGLRNSALPFALDDPPRKLILSSPVFQVVNSNTVKDRFLFLFNDILVIAKPILQDQDSMLDSAKISIPDRRFLIKSVVQLRHLRLRIDRDDNSAKAHMSGSLKHTLVRTFVHQFAKDPDQAIATLFEKARSRDDPVGLGQLMFKTLDLDRAKLGDYLSRRTSKFVLKSYIDGFGFAGLRVDKALRVFLQTINIPAKSYAHFNPAEYILDAFASRWYDANSGIVAYDKDLAVKLVRAIVQLNEVLHGGIAQEPGISSFPKRNVTARDFVEAFRRYDIRGLVSDELLENISGSIRHERLNQARNPAKQSGQSDTIITIKRGLPLRLTYRVQSEPVILRIPQPDAQLSIQLFGQELTFDPPILNFTKSSEVSFRVTGTSLGPKNIIMWRSGANALSYSGLPQSSVVMVERAFMRNTFQVAFADFHGERRRYMFSVDDPVLRHQWAMSLKRQIDVATLNWESSASDPGISKFHLAAENVAFKVLQESLLDDDIDRGHINGSFTYLPPQTPNGKPHYVDPRKGMALSSSLHARSKSRSQVYHRSMAGKMEIDLEVPINGDAEVGDVAIQPHGVWNGQEIEMICRQNSSIATILSHLLAASPGHSSEGSGESRRNS